MSRPLTLGPWEAGPVSRGRTRRFLAGLALFGTLLAPFAFTGAALAACPTAGSTTCWGYFYGLYARQDEAVNGTILAEIYFNNAKGSVQYNKNHRKTNDPNGDRQMIEARFRDRQPTNGNGVYVWGRWALNGSYCYTSNVGVSAGPSGQIGVQIGVACTSGWHNADDYEDKSTYYSDGSWHTSINGIVQPFDLLSSSSRVLLMPCEDQAFAPDDCIGDNAGKILGVKY